VQDSGGAHYVVNQGQTATGSADRNEGRENEAKQGDREMMEQPGDGSDHYQGDYKAGRSLHDTGNQSSPQPKSTINVKRPTAPKKESRGGRNNVEPPPGMCQSRFAFSMCLHAK